MRLSMLIFLMWCSICNSSSKINEKFMIDNNENVMAVAVLDVIMNFYRIKTTTINIYQSFSSKKDFDIQSDIINEVLRNINHEVDIHLESNVDAQLHGRQRKHSIFVVDSYESFRKIFIKMNLEMFDYEGYYLIVFTARVANDLIHALEKILKDCWSYNIVNSNILFRNPDDHNESLILTFFPWGDDYCDKVRPVYLDGYKSNKSNEGLDFFPDKTRNFHLCPLKIATYETQPFMKLTELGNNSYDISGLEGNMVKRLAEIMNFTIELVIVPERWGSTYPNGTVTGAIKLVHENIVDLTVGYFAQTITRNKYMKNGMFYYSYKLKWIVPPGQEFPPFDKLMKPFQMIFWIYIGLLIVISLVVITVLQKFTPSMRNFVIGQHVNHPILNLIGIFFGVAVPVTPTRNFARYLFMVFSMYCLVIRNSYQGSMFKYLQTDLRENVVESTKEMIDKNFTFYMLPSGKFKNQSLRKKER